MNPIENKKESNFLMERSKTYANLLRKQKIFVKKI
jgi:hypothetical protein